MPHLAASVRLAALTCAVIAASGAVTGPAAGQTTRPAPVVTAVPVTDRFTGFAPAADVVIRLACGPGLTSVRADAGGVAVLPPGTLVRVPTGRYRLLVTGAGPTGSTPTTGTVLVTVPTTHVVGIRADGTGVVWVDPGVPVPSC